MQLQETLAEIEELKDQQQIRQSEFELKLRKREYEIEELKSQKEQQMTDLMQTSLKAESQFKQQIQDLHKEHATASDDIQKQFENALATLRKQNSEAMHTQT